MHDDQIGENGASCYNFQFLCEKYVKCIISVNIYIKCFIRRNVKLGVVVSKITITVSRAGY